MNEIFQYLFVSMNYYFIKQIDKLNDLLILALILNFISKTVLLVYLSHYLHRFYYSDKVHKLKTLKYINLSSFYKFYYLGE